MTTKLIGLKEFRQNLSTYTKEAEEQQIRFIVLKKNIPILEVKPFQKRAQFTLEDLMEEIKEARGQAKRGKVYSQKEIMKERYFGLCEKTKKFSIWGISISNRRLSSLI